MTRTEKVILVVIAVAVVASIGLGLLVSDEIKACGPAVVTERKGDREVMSFACKGSAE